jgi:hypothetical protein
MNLIWSSRSWQSKHESHLNLGRTLQRFAHAFWATGLLEHESVTTLASSHLRMRANLSAASNQPATSSVVSSENGPSDIYVRILISDLTSFVDGKLLPREQKLVKRVAITNCSRKERQQGCGPPQICREKFKLGSRGSAAARRR